MSKNNAIPTAQNQQLARTKLTNKEPLLVLAVIVFVFMIQGLSAAIAGPAAPSHRNSPETIGCPSDRSAAMFWRIAQFLTVLVVTAGFLLCTTAAHATLISVGDPVFGPDSITRDTDMELEWLDLTLSTNRSFNDVSGQFGLGGDFEGFRYASLGEISTFWTNAGILDIEMFTEANLEPVAILMSSIGCTASCGSSIVVSSIGLSGTFASASIVFAPAINQLLAQTPPVGGAILTSNIAVTTFKNPQFGSWLVRPVPEPTTLFLFGTGLLGLIGYARCRKR